MVAPQDEDEGESEGEREAEGPRPLSRDRCATLGMAVLLASGVGAFFGNATLAFTRVFKELGVDRPSLVDAAEQLGLPGSAVAWGLLGLGVCLAAARLPRRAALPLLAACVLGAIGLVVVGVGGFAAARGIVARLRRELDDGAAPPAPVRAAPLAAEVAEAVRRDVLAARTFVTPRGTTRAFFIYDGPGAPAPPPADAPYAQVHAHPACVLLPGGPAGNKERTAEAITLLPRLMPDLSPAAVDAGAEAITFELAPATDGATVPRLRSTLEASSSSSSTSTDHLSFAVTLERERLRGEGDPERAACGPGDRFSDRLYLVRVLVFSGFDPARAGAALVPRSNVPLLAVTTEVRR